ncbi:EcoKI restriction-modification system protein HsdS [Serratia marcescens]|jgi:type I restriction enzyme S subunit|uniref:restriction endonuclease subunit S n=2 Tax=Serratia marcescens TaxID=615 RepID=UPI0003159F62|nr:restriction endonuclease subunit S [Serratia marcescens]MCC7688607.1 restriction endonuclease subunit S [Serratia marcescens]CAI0995076.1 EcoKI restriction-modification system protein HsdS [Serratia marcescens]CAI1010300.1 EcoKI restriction-modification system protein HsdS [Serratia marcescens]HEB0050333.1 restriction endonuclease subunit S [Serratia marcescens]HEB0067741.1 restriction endonuclease subunit S [Serratia marcescens]
MAKLNKYKPYESYTDTSAVWYKQKPAHWECERFKYHFIEKKKKNSTCLPAGAISFGEVIFKNEDNLSQDTKSSYQEVCAGEFLINPLNLNFDLKSLRTALSTIDVVVSTGYIVLQDCGFLHPRFARWLLQQFDVSHMKTLGAGVRQTINYADIGNSLFCRPTFEEQKIIAAFLDYETQKIDKLIEKQQQLIELLKEKRQAVISHAVTKGLNPDVPMKDSGVEWLGEVPEDWQLKQLRHLCSSKGGGTPSKNNPKFWIGDIPWVSPKDMKAQYIYDAEDHVSEEAVKLSSTKKIPIDSVLIVVRGMILAHSVPVSINKEIVTINQDMKALIPNENITSEYFYLVLTGFKRFLLELTDNSAHGTKCLRTDLLEKLWIPLPSIKQQEEIIRNVNELVAKLDSLVLRQEEAKKLLQERRTALISAAVTGKIDVRDWVASDMQDAEEPQETTA